MPARDANKRPKMTRRHRVSFLSSPVSCKLMFGICGVLAGLGCLLFLLLLDSVRSAKWHVWTNVEGPRHSKAGCHAMCSTTFGVLLGAHNGVFAYSNCNSTTCISNEIHAVSVSPATELYSDIDAMRRNSGIKWQCVEYARRYWMMRGSPVGATFSLVTAAADIWSLTTVQLLNGSTVPLLKYANGAPADTGGSAPRVGDLLIYPKQRTDFPFGHVAVVVDVTSGSVLVAEQNWENTVWPAPHHNYSREIPMRHDADAKTYTITDEDDIKITGWVRYGM
ncbi:D-alanyl-glycyl endopeptidase-like protein [Trypanosoma grayi]|uniref:D-alanyl-glycyl endopeptidase-like protein n=1 Tax=Trypanosoma grayi TaxID=71804 RepID=UPI0004F41E56|nr:D-alanyl-glycyl endopeptidase-like protein [Trypanosoma grayi]KEG10649.1 D-alanyl-glycyl endopeptidase-like protein [Trypanosoma grayi]